MKIKDIKNIIEKKFDLVDKKNGVYLVEMGFLKYEKLTPENYNYWWYEVEDKSKINKKIFTYNWKYLTKTRKMKFLELLIDYHEENENGYNLINNVLNIISALEDGVNIKTKRLCFDEVFEMYYGNRTKKPKQLKLF